MAGRLRYAESAYCESEGYNEPEACDNLTKLIGFPAGKTDKLSVADFLYLKIVCIGVDSSHSICYSDIYRIIQLQFDNR